MKYITISLAILFSATSFAGTASGKITGYIPYSTGQNGLFFIKVENAVNTPTCNTTTRFTMRNDNPKYNSTNAAVLAALMAGTTVVVKGNGTCDNFGNSEDLAYICLGSTPC